MEFGCPVCNGFTTISKSCPGCQKAQLIDRGTLEDFYGPYSPYEFQELYEIPKAGDQTGDSCVHLLSCPVCGYDERIDICQIVM